MARLSNRRNRLIVLLAFGVAAMSFGLMQVANAGDLTGISAAATTVAVAGGEHEYVGSNKCKKCHIKVYKSWEETTMGQAYETLKPGAKAEAKTKAGLDPEKDYTTDENCVTCHVTGMGHGGFALESDEKAAKKMEKAFGAVGCESCHGPGSEYIKVHEEIQKSKRTYKQEEMYSAGMTKIDESTCTACHNDKSPTHSGEFKYDPADRTGLHELPGLEQREG